MELIKICKSLWLKVNCFPECVGVYDTCDTPGTEINLKKVTAVMTTLVQNSYQQTKHGGSWTTRTFGFILKTF